MTMQSGDRIFVAGHRGLVGSALVRNLITKGYQNLILRTHAELDLTDQHATEAFFAAAKPDYVFLAAAKVGGILANNNYPAGFIRDNLAIQTNVIHSAWRHRVRRLLFLGSSCIYPKLATQPIKEDCLLSGPLEPTNRPYAVAKIAGIEMCWSYNREYGTRYLAAMPTNLYGPGDTYDLENSHVLPALLRKMHEAATRRESEVVVWGTGTPRREFLYSDDLGDACVFLMALPDQQFDALTAGDRAPLVNIGCGDDLTIRDLAELVAKVVGFHGRLRFDVDKPDGTMRKVLDVSRIDALGWHPRTPLESGIATAYADYLARSGAPDAQR